MKSSWVMVKLDDFHVIFLSKRTLFPGLVKLGHADLEVALGPGKGYVQA